MANCDVKSEDGGGDCALGLRVFGHDTTMCESPQCCRGSARNPSLLQRIPFSACTVTSLMNSIFNDCFETSRVLGSCGKRRNVSSAMRTDCPRFGSETLTRCPSARYSSVPLVKS